MDVKCRSGRNLWFMGPIDFFWHLLNLFAVAMIHGLVVATGARWIWRRELAPVAWTRLVAAMTACAMLSTALGLALFGRDGRMATYGLMLLATAAALGVVRYRRRS